MLFGLAGLGLFSWLAVPGFAIPQTVQKPNSSPSLSARFHQNQYTPDDAVQLEKFRQIAARFPSDSTHYYKVRNGRLEISYDLMQELHEHTLADTGTSFSKRFAAYLGQKHGLHIRPSGIAYGLYTPDDEWYTKSPQWALHNTGITIADRPAKAGVDVNIEKVWDKFSGSDSLIIAVVDAGFSFDHPELKGKNWRNMAEVLGKPNIDDDNNGFVDDSVGWDFVNDDNFPDDYNGHGTSVSSIIAAAFDNGKGIAGVVPQCRIMPIRVLDASGMGNQDDISKAILYAINNGAKVINFSIGGDVDNTAMRTAFQTARDRGVPIVVAAGNDAQDLDVVPSYPSSFNYDNLLVVAAHDHAGLLCSFSNFGKNSVDLAAPGEYVLAAAIPGPLTVWKEGFESPTLSAWNFSNGSFALSTVEPLLEKQSLVWSMGNNACATSATYIDLTGRDGSVLKLQISYHPASAFDALVVEANVEGSSLWTTLGVVNSDVKANSVLTYGLQALDGKKFKLRFRNYSKISSLGRILKLDGLTITAHDPNPPDRNIYQVVSGTSIAAPHVTGYVAMQRLACDRMGQTWTRNLALAGIVQEPVFASKVATGGRLDMYKGLQFYLSTLPDFRVVDSTLLTWRVGEQAHYTLEVTPIPALAYKYSFAGLGASAMLDASGKLLWVPGISDTGTHIVTLTAAGTTLLRKRFSLQVQNIQPVANKNTWTSGNTSGCRWQLAGQEFQVQQGMLTGRHWVEISGTDVLGKVRMLKKGWMAEDDFRQDWELGSTSVSFAQIQVHVDGILLARTK